MTPDGLEEHFYFGGGGTSSNITPVGICILILGCLAILLVRRKWLTVPFIVVTLLLPIGQVVVILSAHLSIWRFLIFLAWIRISWLAFITKSDPFPGPLNLLDKVFLGWAFCNAIAYSILWSDTGALLNKLGFLYAGIGTYFIFRYLIRDRADVIRAIRVLAIVAAPIAISMAVEHSTGRNPFAMLGGLDELSNIRDGRVRAQGPFLHSIVAGSFGAMQFPLFVMLWFEGKGNRLRAVLGMVAATVITITAASSTPLIAYVSGVIALCFWPLRRRMRLVRWCAVFALIALQLVMKAPVWFLMNRVAAVIGGTGWHRAELIDQFVHRFFEWWLIGTRDNANWGLDMWDTINAYVRAGVEGGLVTFLLFLSILVIAFQRIGRAQMLAKDDPKNQRLLFGLGATLFSNAVAFLGIIYFDQSAVAWYLTLVLISVTTSFVLETKKAEAEPEILFPLRPRALKVNKQPAPARPVPTYRNRIKV